MASLVDTKPSTFGNLALASSALKYASSSESELNKNSQVMIFGSFSRQSSKIFCSDRKNSVCVNLPQLSFWLRYLI